ncbi:Myoferlin [Phytophthora citrophthora]|uniref:Myoferlin n=1 Tax=Phytophthora citrophthora TaxID=4793 RepID=A0AAD9GUA4_9STRA|nr:Myoferlin [Phytophthora citrophthora]
MYFEHSEIEDTEDAPVEILPKEVRLAEDGGRHLSPVILSTSFLTFLLLLDDTLPNSLVITVLQARHLQPSPLRSTLSCYVKLSSLGVEYKTSVMTKTREPRWHEVFVFRAVDWTTNVTVSLRDRLPLKMHFLGQVAISSADIANLPGMITRRWFRLRDQGITGQFTGAELELKVALVYTKANDQSLSQTGPAAMEIQREVDPALVDIMVGQEDETEEEAAARTKALLRRETQEREASAALAALKQGDYQVQVHIIEARDLKGENLSGTSDPYCQVEILGKSRKTATRYDTLGCVFDEMLFFNFSNIGRHELREASIKVRQANFYGAVLILTILFLKISVYDKERILKDNLIGVYQLDCLSVYAQPDHELYRQWIAVHDNLNEKDRGIQGFLLVSVVVLGPGDSLRVHDREAEMEVELTEATGEKADDSPSTASPLVLVPPSIELKLQFLVVRVLRAEHLPAMDTGSLIGAPGIDAYLQVAFAANVPCKTSVVTVKGRGQLAPDFYEELWLPVRIPTFSRHIGLSVWDRDLTSPNELVGVASHDFLQVPIDPLAGQVAFDKPPGSPERVNLKLEDSDEEIEIEEDLTETGMREQLEVEEAQHQIIAAAPRWYNFYGPPLRGTNSKRKKLVSRHPELGSTYRGRVLLSMIRMESPKPEDGEKMRVKSMSEADRERFEKTVPKTVKYMLRGALYSGVELPRSSSPITGNPSQVRVKISLGPYSITYESHEVAKDGTATFEQCLDHRSVLELPADLTQIPDIIVTLSRTIGGVVSTSPEDFISVSFARFRSEDVFARGFTGKPQWVMLREEITRRQTRHALETSQTPGVLLLKLGFGRLEMATRHPWVDEADSSELFAPFRSPRVHREIRVHIFQARGLEASIGVAREPNPAVNVRCCGQQKRTTTRPSTCSPLFYETLVFLTNVPASDVVYTPEILFQMKDMNGSTTLGELRLSLTSAVRSVATAGSPKPRWYELKRPRSRSSTSVGLLLAEQAGGGVAGQVLIAIQYIDHKGPVPPAILREPAPITPKYTEANLDIVALGVRHLKALSTLGIRRPHVEFELVGGSFLDEPKIKRIESFITPIPKWKQTEFDKPKGNSISNKNANFLDRIVARVKLPVDILYAPQLQIRVCDSTLGGLRKTTLASCTVDLATKLPWSPTYRVEIAAGSGSPFRSPSKRKKNAKGQQWGENPKDEDEFGDFLLDEEQPEEEMARSKDDGVGVGDLSLPSVSYVHTRVSNVLALDTDPALFEQRRREEQRRYNAGKSALLLSNRAKDRGSALESPKNSEQPRVPYLQGRDWWISQYGGEELENYFSTPALETYQLQRPVLSRPSLLSFERVRVLLRAGIFKGRITVIERRTSSDSRSPEQERAKQESLELRRLQNGPQPVLVRVYVLRGQNLHARSSNNKPNPYLRLKLGGDRINDQANACTSTLQPEFFRMFELETTLPGASQLDISVWDRGLISDQLIGSTTIDLEERWFHREWQEIGDDPSSGERDNKLKPIEYRHLYVPQNRSTSQGFVQLWVDILTTQEAVRVKPVDISPPEPKKFEVRVVVWRAENVQDQVQSEINDYFVKAWMENNDSGSEKAESTDTHWRCSNGKPCWNWRLILKTEFPPRSPEMARLHLQLWDKDVLKWNDVLGEAQLDLYKWLRRAYETNRSVAPFLELKLLSQQPVINIDVPKEDSEDTDEDFNENFYEEEEDMDIKLLPGEGSSLLDKTAKKPAEKKKKSVKKQQEPSAATRKLAKAQKDEAEAEAALSGLLDFVGLGRLPDDAEWIPIYFTDREAAVAMEMGQIGISLQIVPEDEAETSPVGKGQNPPNLNPYLPPPVGRMRLTANPIAMFKVLVGPKMCLRLSLLCCCFGCIAFISVFGATVMSTLTYLQSIEARHKRGP